MQQHHHRDPLPISASGTDRCACTAANPDYEAVTNGWCARRHVANAERGEWESWKVIRDASPLPPVTRPFLRPKSILSARILRGYFFFFFNSRHSSRPHADSLQLLWKEKQQRQKDIIITKNVSLCHSVISLILFSKNRVYKMGNGEKMNSTRRATNSVTYVAL